MWAGLRGWGEGVRISVGCLRGQVFSEVSLRSGQGRCPCTPLEKPCCWFRFWLADREPVRTAALLRMVGGPSGSHPPRVHTRNFELNLIFLEKKTLRASTELSCAHGAGVIPRFHSRAECLYSMRTGARSAFPKRKERKRMRNEAFLIGASGAKPREEKMNLFGYSDGTWGALENLKSLNPSAEPTSP
jgi:hypothetical protein